MRRRMRVLLVGGIGLVGLLGSAGAGAGAAPTGVAPTWTSVPSPNLFPDGYNTLQAMSCVGPSFCAAVGGASNDTSQRTLIEMWNGHTWTLIKTPVVGAGSATSLGAVSCTSPTFCVAVGQLGNGPSQGVIESWNGATWSVTPSPALTSDVLNGVSCIDSSHCVAVGTAFGNTHVLIETWNGSLWTLKTTANPPGDPFEALYAVSCTSRAFCMATGGNPFEDAGNPAIIGQWNGTAWTYTPEPDSLDAVSCSGPYFCMAAGQGSDNLETTLTWDGSSWSGVATPSPAGSAFNNLNGVSCVNPATCTAVGWALGSSDVFTTDLLEWNGSAWSITPTPPTPTHTPQQSSIPGQGISCAAEAGCEVATSYIGTTGTDTFVLSGPLRSPG